MKKFVKLELLPFLALFLVLLLYYVQPPFLEGFEARTYDLRTRMLRASVAPAPEIAIIAIDDKSIAEIGRYPWSRDQFTRLLNITAAAGARAVLFDLIFPEHQAAAIDADLAAAARTAGTTTFAEAFELAPDGSVTGCTKNIPVIHDAAARIAHINVFPDEDGVLRWTRLVIPYEGKHHPSLGFSGALAALGGDGTFTAEAFRIAAGPRRIPVDTEHKMLINYTGGAGTFQRFSFVDVVNGKIQPEQLKDRILLVGATALAVYDMRVTPVSNNMPGVEVNANAIATILRGDFMRRGVPEALLDLFSIVVLGSATIFLTMKVRHGASLPLVVLLAAAYLATTCLLFAAGRWVSVVYPVLAVLATFAATAYLRFFHLESKARQIRSMFSCYVSKKVVDELVRNPDAAKIGGEARIVTIMFADVKNYTSYSENRSPEEVVRILNEYLAEMTNIILEHDGTLDKFLGDGILAYWNAPVKQDDHAELAVRCAYRMMKRMGPLQEKWRRHGDEPLTWGIGLNTGEVIIGNIGAEGKKMEYTAIGDNVNLTYRIQNEGRDKECPVITKALYERVKDLVKVEPMGQVMVKGKQLPIDIYAVLEVQDGRTSGDVTPAFAARA